MSYQPFLIAPFGTGLDTDLSPWMLPQDAFSKIVNANIHHGVVEKREGSTYYGSLVHKKGTDWDIVGITNASPGVITVADTTGITTGDVIEIRDVTGMTEINQNQYTVTNTNGTTLTLINVDTTNFTGYVGSGGVYLIPKDRVMGLWNYIDSSSVKEVVAFDTKRASSYNPTNNQFDAIDVADVMNGGANDYIWSANWASTASTTASTLYRMYFTNGLARSGAGLNGIRYYGGGSTTLPFNPLINGGNEIKGCKLIFAFAQRLLLLSTFEGGNQYQQRARWSQAQKPGNSGAFTDEWDDDTPGKGGYVDAPTGQRIISAQFLQDVLVVFFTDSVWTLRRTADPALPFRWDKVNDFRSCDGKMTTAQFDRYVLSAGVRGITATDGVETKRIDNRIEDFVEDEINNGSFQKVFAKRSYANRRLWMLYPSIEVDTANAALIYDEESTAFSQYDIDMNVLGYGGAEEDAAINDFGDKTLDEFDDDILTSYFLDDGSEVFLGGDQSGDVFNMERGSDDKEKIFFKTIINVSQASPGVVTMIGDVELSDGDVITISDIAVGSMVELNDRSFEVAGKSGNTFQLLGEDTSGYAAYVLGSAGTVGITLATSVATELYSAAWNPWMTEGKQSQLGYIDLYLDTEASTTITVQFYTNNDLDPYVEKTINLLPNLKERSTIANITNASPGNVTSNQHGLSTNDEIYIYLVDGMRSINGQQFTVTVIDGNNFTIGVDTTNYGLYANDGIITQLPYNSTKAWKRVHAGGTGYQHRMRILSKGTDKPLSIHAFMPWFKPRGRSIG